MAVTEGPVSRYVERAPREALKAGQDKTDALRAEARQDLTASWGRRLVRLRTETSRQVTRSASLVMRQSCPPRLSGCRPRSWVKRTTCDKRRDQS